MGEVMDSAGKGKRSAVRVLCVFDVWKLLFTVYKVLIERVFIRCGSDRLP